VASRERHILARCQPNERGEDGVVLVLWVLCLAALIGLLAGAVNLGNLAQGVVNTQDAADSAALGGAGQLGAELPLRVYASVRACDGSGSWRGDGQGDCHCPPDLSLGCGNSGYRWLNGYYIYVQDQGWLQIPLAMSAEKAFMYGLSQGWSCSASFARRHHGLARCLEVSTNVLGSAPGALTDGTTVGELGTAVQHAESLAETYYPPGQGPDWSACASLPTGFAIAQTGDKCVGYEVSPDAYDYWTPAAPEEYLLFWVQVISSSSSPLGNGVSEVKRDAYAAWAPGSPGAQGAAPWGPLGPSRVPGWAHLCSPDSTCSQS
jgi:hypothetical protein